jgi:hypothetical protein
MANKELKNTSSVIQKFILEGEKLFFKEKQPIFVKIRFNHNDVDGTRKWRVIFNEKEFHVSEILIEISCKTESEFHEDLGGYKHHIVCNANKILFNQNICTIK